MATQMIVRRLVRLPEVHPAVRSGWQSPEQRHAAINDLAGVINSRRLDRYERVSRTRSVPVTVAEQELLPPGMWPIKRTGSGRNNFAPSTQDLRRFDFLQGLHRLVEIVEFPAFRSKRKYKAFVLTAASGKRIALVETDQTLNAMYAFDADLPEWEAVTRCHKRAVLATQPREFLGRIYHRGRWEERVQTLLATH